MRIVGWFSAGFWLTLVVGAFRIVCSKVQTEFLTTKAEVLLPLLTKCTECVPQQYRLPILPIVQQ